MKMESNLMDIQGVKAKYGKIYLGMSSRDHLIQEYDYNGTFLRKYELSFRNEKIINFSFDINEKETAYILDPNVPRPHPLKDQLPYQDFKNLQSITFDDMTLNPLQTKDAQGNIFEVKLLPLSNEIWFTSVKTGERKRIVYQNFLFKLQHPLYIGFLYFCIALLILLINANTIMKNSHHFKKRPWRIITYLYS